MSLSLKILPSPGTNAHHFLHISFEASHSTQNGVGLMASMEMEASEAERICAQSLIKDKFQGQRFDSTDKNFLLKSKKVKGTHRLS